MNTTLKFSILISLLINGLSVAMPEGNNNKRPTLAQLAFEKMPITSLTQKEKDAFVALCSSSRVLKDYYKIKEIKEALKIEEDCNFDHLQHIPLYYLLVKTKNMTNERLLNSISSMTDEQLLSNVFSINGKKLPPINGKKLIRSITSNRNSDLMMKINDLRKGRYENIILNWDDLYRACEKIEYVPLYFESGGGLPFIERVYSQQEKGEILKNIDQLKHLRSLSFLRLRNMGLNTLEKIKDCKNLAILDVGDNPITDFSALEGFKELTHLGIKGNDKITAIPKEILMLKKLLFLTIDEKLKIETDSKFLSELKERRIKIITKSGPFFSYKDQDYSL